MSSIQTGGYNSELFVSEIDDTFKCPFCHDVMRNPVELACQHVYCKSCIIQVLDNNGQCPECRRDVEKSTNGDWIYDPPRRYFRNMHSSLRLKCDLEGCEHITTIEAYQTHQSTCEFNPNRPVQCQKCKAEMCSFELNDHDCFQYLVTKVNMMEAANGKLELALAAAVADLQVTQTSAQNIETKLELKIKELQTSVKDTNVNTDLKIKELETSTKDTSASTDLKIKELETTGKLTEATLELLMKEMEIIRIECIRKSDSEKRTVFVRQSDTMYKIHDKFMKELGSDETLYSVSYPGAPHGDWNNTVKDKGVKSGYKLVFSKV